MKGILAQMQPFNGYERYIGLDAALNATRVVACLGTPSLGTQSREVIHASVYYRHNGVATVTFQL